MELAIALDDGEAEPLRITVPRESRVSVVANDESRIPKGVGHAVTVRSTDGVDAGGRAEPGLGGRRGSVGRGWSSGARAPARGWVFAAGQADAYVDEFLAVVTPSAVAEVWSPSWRTAWRREMPGRQTSKCRPGAGRW